jgi:hypothetical protein
MSSVWRAQRASTSMLLFAFRLPQPRLPSIFTRPHLDSADKDKANQLRCILHYMYSSFWTLHAMLDEAPKTRPPWMLTPQRTRVPSARGSDLIGVMISILTLCLASTGLETIIRAIASSLRLPDLTVQCSDILRRPTARFNTGLCLSICTFPRRHHRSHLPTFPRHRDPFHLAGPYSCISPIRTAKSYQCQKICHLHDGLDCPRETRHLSCHVSVRDMLTSTSVFSW